MMKPMVMATTNVWFLNREGGSRGCVVTYSTRTNAIRATADTSTNANRLTGAVWINVPPKLVMRTIPVSATVRRAAPA